MRLTCRFFGCNEDYDDKPYCERCGAALYDADFIQNPCFAVRWYLRVDWLTRDVFYFIAGRHCEQCKTRFWPKWKAFESCCSDRCYSLWIPF